jgi:hypothetical protein
VDAEAETELKAGESTADKLGSAVVALVGIGPVTEWASPVVVEIGSAQEKVASGVVGIEATTDDGTRPSVETGSGTGDMLTVVADTDDNSAKAEVDSGKTGVCSGIGMIIDAVGSGVAKEGSVVIAAGSETAAGCCGPEFHGLDSNAVAVLK